MSDPDASTPTRELGGLPEAAGDCVGVIIHVIRGHDAAAEFLFLLRSGGKYEGQWWPVAGTCEAGEDPVETAIREIDEEISLTPQALFTTGRAMDHPTEPGHLQIFVAFVPADAEVTLNYEHSERVWLGVEETVDFVPDEMEGPIRDMQARFLLSAPLAEWLLWGDALER